MKIKQKNATQKEWREGYYMSGEKFEAAKYALEKIEKYCGIIFSTKWTEKVAAERFIERIK